MKFSILSKIGLTTIKTHNETLEINRKAKERISELNGEVKKLNWEIKQLERELNPTLSKGRLRNWADRVKKNGNGCDVCGVKNPKGGFQAHHIYPKSYYQNLAYDESNGVVLCIKCHDNLHDMISLEKCNPTTYKEFKKIQNLKERNKELEKELKGFKEKTNNWFKKIIQF